MIIPDRAVSVNPFSQTFSKTLRISMIIAKGGAHSLFILSKGQTFRRYSGSPLEAKNALSQGARNGRLRRPGIAGSPAGTKGDRTPYGFLSPLDSPYLPLRRDALRLRGETGVTGARFRAFFSLYVAVMP